MDSLDLGIGSDVRVLRLSAGLGDRDAVSFRHAAAGTGAACLLCIEHSELGQDQSWSWA